MYARISEDIVGRRHRAWCLAIAYNLNDGQTAWRLTVLVRDFGVGTDFWSCHATIESIQDQDGLPPRTAQYQVTSLATATTTSACVLDLQVLVSTYAGITEDIVRSSHGTSSSALTSWLDNMHGAGSGAVCCFDIRVMAQNWSGKLPTIQGFTNVNGWGLFRAMQLDEPSFAGAFHLTASLTFAFAGVVYLEILVGANAGVAEYTICSWHSAWCSSIAIGVHDTERRRGEAGSCMDISMRANTVSGSTSIISVVDPDDSSRRAGQRKSSPFATPSDCILKGKIK